MRKLLLAILLFLTLICSSCNLPPVGGSSGDVKDDGGVSGDAAHAHTDQDDNGACDECRLSVISFFDFYAINDMHGKLLDAETHIGADELTTYLSLRENVDDNVIVLSVGDMWQGSAESNLTKGAMMTEWMNAVSCVGMTIGNHEFDWGERYLEENKPLARFPFLAINIYNRETNRLVEYCTPSVLLEYGDIKIGIIGAIGDCYSSISPEKVSDVYFKVGSELTSLVKAESQRLRDEGADFIVYSLHDGRESTSNGIQNVTSSDISSYYDVSLSNGYVDLVFEAHTHQSYILRDSYGVYHLQGGGDNEGITHVELKINCVTGTFIISEIETVKSSVYQHLEDDSIVYELYEKYNDQISVGEELLGENSAYRSGNELRQKIAELYAAVGEAHWADYDIVLGGGYLSVRSPGCLPIGEVYYKDLYGLFPFDNDLVLCSVKGITLQNRFINNNQNYYSGYTEYGKNIRGSIDPDVTYYIVVDTYSAYYAPNRLTVVDFYDEGVYARDLLADYIRGGNYDHGIDGSEEYTLTSIEEANEIGASLSLGETSETYYYVKGEVVSITNTKYGNMYIADEKGNQIYVYGVYDLTGKIRFDSLLDQPQVGDTVVLYAPISNYNSSSGSLIELKSARLVSHTRTVLQSVYHTEMLFEAIAYGCFGKKHI